MTRPNLDAVCAASPAPWSLIAHYQLTVGLLRANLPSQNARITIAGSESAREYIPVFGYIDVAALAANQQQRDRSATGGAIIECARFLARLVCGRE